ncbi:hypothetical protein [Paracidovorax oryzae]|uniref:hypothetical protein n=1 Tax=Paracidovorax oryzae TaxID=862720 RepID=UPI0002F7EA45|nr:hypothetical protein [Paracidovorax oryzae]
MYCTVYRLRSEGEKLAQPDVRSTAVSGWLIYRAKREDGAPERHAYLVRDERGRIGLEEVLPTLQFVDVRAIDRGGILMRGLELRSNPYQQLRQTWWIVPLGPDFKP